MKKAGARPRWMGLAFLILLVSGASSPSQSAPTLRVAYQGYNACTDAPGAVYYSIGGSTTLQTVVDAAVSDDVILICAGEYFDNMVINNKTLTIKGEEDPNPGNAQFVTTLNGNNTKRQLEFVGTASPGRDLTVMMIKFINGKATSNQAFNGGAVFFQGRNLLIEDCLFEHNSAGTGGAVYGWSGGMIAGEMRVFNSNFGNNSADFDGGAIHAGIPAYFDNAGFNANYADDNGGAIHSWSYLDIDESEFTSNYAPAGGAVDMYASDAMAIKSSAFIGNRAPFGGGALRAVARGGSTIDGSYFEGNSNRNSEGGMENGKGGAVNFYDWDLEGTLCDGNVSITNTQFVSNEAGTDGGAIAFDYIDGCGEYFGRTTSIDRGTFHVNTAIGNGGGIFSSDPLSIEASKFEINRAINGGGIYSEGALAMKSSQFNSNEAVVSAGAIYLQGQNTNSTIAENCGFVQNTAAAGAAALEILDENFRLTDAKFIQNVATDHPIVSIRNPGLGTHTVLIDRSIFRENDATRDDELGSSTLEMPVGGVIRNSLLHHNYTANHVLDGAYKIINSTIYNNRPTDGQPGSIYQIKGNHAGNEIVNSVIWHGKFLDAKTKSLFPNSNIPSYSVVKNGPPGLGNLDQDPGLRNPDFETLPNAPFDFRPGSFSLVVNRGLNSADHGDEDLLKLPRVYRDFVDIGAYELQTLNTFQIITETKQGAGDIKPNKVTYNNGDNAIVSVVISKPDFEAGSRLEKIVITDLVTGLSEEKTAAQLQVGTVHEHEWIHEIVSIGRNYKIDAYFKLHDVPVTVKIIDGGGKAFDENGNLLISGAGQVQFNRTFGTDVSVYFKPDPRYYVSSVKVDGVLQGDANHTPLSATIEQLKVPVLIEVTFAACGTPEDVNPSFVMTTALADPSNPQYSITYSDGFGRGIQTQRVTYGETGGNKRVVQGAYWDRNGRPVLSVLPYVEMNEGEEFEFVPMACRELVDHANGYHDGGLDENGIPKRNAENYAFSETVYKNRPGEVAQKSGSPGLKRSANGNTPKKWSFTTNLPKGFLPAALLDEGSLDRRYDEQFATNTTDQYTLAVEKDADNNFTQTITDKFGNLVASWKNPVQGSDEDIIVTENRYDALGNNVKVILPSVSGQASQTMELSYDQMGKMKKSITPDNGIVETRYDSLSRVRFTKDALQQRLAELNAFEDEIGYFTIRNYDVLDRLVSIGLSINPSEDFNKPNLPVVGRIRKQFIYDKISDSELASMGVPNAHIQAFKNELENTDKRLVGSIVWDEGGIPTSEIASYYKNGNLKGGYKIIPGIPIQKFKYEYTDAGLYKKRMFYSGYTLSGSSLNWIEKSVNEVEHDKNLKPKSISEGGLKFVDYSHNYLGDLQKKNIYFAQNSAASESMEYRYDINGLAKIKSGDANDRFEQTITYDSDIPAKKYFSGQIQSNSYSYKTADNQAPNSEYMEYEYNGVNQLVKVDKTLNGNFRNDYGFYKYDEMGRFIKKVEGDKDYDLFEYANGKNQLLAIGNDGDRNNEFGNFAYDPNGNMVLDRFKKMTVDYDFAGMAVRFRFYNMIPADINLDWLAVRNGALASLSGVQEVSVVEMTYDINSKRVLKIQKEAGVKKNGKAYVENLAVYTMVEGSGFDLDHVNWVTGGGVTGKTEPGGSKYFYMKDNQGSSRVVLKSDQTFQQVMGYDPYGNLIHTKSPPNGAASIEETFTEKEFDKDGRVAGGSSAAGIDAYYFGARYFDPELGMWMSPDPAGQFPNPYFYGGDPVNFVDPNGEFIIEAAIIGAIAGAYFGGVQATGSYAWEGFDMREDLDNVLVGAAAGAVAGATGAYVATPASTSMAFGASGTGMLGTGITVTHSAGLGMGATAGAVAGSTAGSATSWALTGGKSDISTSFGAVDVNWSGIERGDGWDAIGYLGKPGNSAMQNIGYGLGAVGNVSDGVALFHKVSGTYDNPNLGDIDLYTDFEGKDDWISHTALEDPDLNVNSVSVGPDGMGNGGGRANWPKHEDRAFKMRIKKVDKLKFGEYARKLKGDAARNKLKWELIGDESCVGHGRKALFASGVTSAAGAIHPYTLHLRMLARNAWLKFYGFY